MRKIPPTSIAVERQFYTPDEACEVLRLSRASLYKLMNLGRLRYVTVLNRRRIPVPEILRLRDT